MADYTNNDYAISTPGTMSAANGKFSVDGSGNILGSGKVGVASNGDVLDGSGFDTFVKARGATNLVHLQVNATDVLTVNQNGVTQLGILVEAEATGTVQTLSTGNTITTVATQGVARVTAAAAVTGIILAAGSFSGQSLVVIHEGAAANTITFAASGTSNVADGNSDVITGPSARRFIWDSVTALWYKCV